MAKYTVSLPWTGWLVLVLAIGCAGCSPSKFIREDKFVTGRVLFPKDSVTLVEPVFSTWLVSYFPSRGLYRLLTGDKDEYTCSQIDIGDRADSIRALVRAAYSQTPVTDTAFFRIKSGCMLTPRCKDKRFITAYNLLYMEDSSYRFSVLDPSLYRCLDLDSNRYNIIHVFTMDLWMQPLGDLDVYDHMRPHVIVLYKNRIVYYRHYFDSIKSDKKHFPVGYPNRDDWPHYPSFQLRRVVDALTRDLAARIH